MNNNKQQQEQNETDIFSDTYQKEEIINYNQNDVDDDQSSISYSLEIEKSQNSLISKDNNKKFITNESESINSNESSATRKLKQSGILQNQDQIMEVVLKTANQNQQEKIKNQQIVAETVDIKIDEPTNLKSYQQLFSEFELKSNSKLKDFKHELSKSFENLESVFKVNSQNMTQEEKEFMNYVHQQKMVSAFEVENTKHKLDSNSNHQKNHSNNTASFQYQDNQTSLNKIYENEDSYQQIPKGNPNTKKSYNLESISELLRKKEELENIKKNFYEFQKVGLDDQVENQFRKTVNDLDEELGIVEKKIKTLQSIDHKQHNNSINYDNNIQQDLQDNDELPEVFLNFKELKQTSMENLNDLQIPKQQPQEILIQALPKNSRRITFSAAPNEENTLKITHNEKFTELPNQNGQDLLSSERLVMKKQSQVLSQEKPQVKRLKKRRDFQKKKKEAKNFKFEKNQQQTYNEYFNDKLAVEKSLSKNIRPKKLKQKSVPNKPLFNSNYLSGKSSQNNQKIFKVLTKNLSSSLQQKQRQDFSTKKILRKKKKVSLTKKLFPIGNFETKSNISSSIKSKKKLFQAKSKSKKFSVNKKLLPLRSSQKIMQRNKLNSQTKISQKNLSLRKNKVNLQVPKFDNFKFKTQTIFKKTPNKYTIENKTKLQKYNNPLQKPNRKKTTSLGKRSK